jgi:hypothetical protein
MNATPIASARDQTRLTRREAKTPNPSLIFSSNSSGKQTNSSPVNFAPVAEILRTKTLRIEQPLLNTQRPSRKHRVRGARRLSFDAAPVFSVGIFILYNTLVAEIYSLDGRRNGSISRDRLSSPRPSMGVIGAQSAPVRRRDRQSWRQNLAQG